MENNWLPIGSVVKINNLPVVVSGYQANCKGDYYRYAGFLYPVGINSKEEAIFFNPDAIQEVLFEGYKFNHFNEVEKSLEKNEKKIMKEQGE